MSELLNYLSIYKVAKVIRKIPNELDPAYTVPDSRSHDIEFGHFAVIFTLTTFSMISC